MLNGDTLQDLNMCDHGQGDPRRPTAAEKGKARARCDSSDSDEEGGSARLPSERLIIGGMRPSDGLRSGRRLSFDDRFLLSEDVTREGQATILQDIEARTPLRFCRATPSDTQLPHYEQVAPEEEVTSDGELQERIARMMDEQLGQGPTFGSAGAVSHCHRILSVVACPRPHQTCLPPACWTANRGVFQV